jgi:hypothetical protein
VVNSEKRVMCGKSLVELDQYWMFAELVDTTLVSQQSVFVFGRFLTVARGTEQ